MKYGLEKELFVLRGDEVQVVPAGMPFDECGILAEARGMPFDNIIDAVFSLRSEVYKIERMALAAGLTLDDCPVRKVPREVRHTASRQFSKGLTSYQNLYGHLEHKNRAGEQTAGVHVSFTCPHIDRVRDENGRWRDIVCNEMFDFVQIFKKLDRDFSDEIKQAKRLPGFYEIKSDGRIEYRSLPANVNLDKVIDVILSCKN